MTTLQEELDRRKQETKRQKLPAQLTFTLMPHHYNDEFPGRPTEPVVVGLRNHTEQDYQDCIATVDAGEEVNKDRALMTALVCRALCDQHDVSRANPTFPRPDDLIPKALRPSTIRAIWDRIEKDRVETSAVMPEAAEEEIGNLIAMLQTDRLLEMDEEQPVKARRVRRFLRYCLDDLDG